jgi:hypothetical protein
MKQVSTEREKPHTLSVEHQWLMPIILATWETEIGRIAIRDQSKQIVHETPSPK